MDTILRPTSKVVRLSVGPKARTFVFYYPVGHVKVTCRVRNDTVLVKLQLAQGTPQGDTLEDYPGYEIVNIHRGGV